MNSATAKQTTEAEANLEPDDSVDQSTVSTAQMAEEMDDEQETIASTSSHSNEVSEPSEPANDESSHDDESKRVYIIGLLWWKSKRAFSAKD